jgi:hypothetical protein
MTGSDTRHIHLAEAVMDFFGELKQAVRSLGRAKGVTVVLTLALGIGANAAVFALVRGVLLRPLANRDEDRLVYIRQSAASASTIRGSPSRKSKICARASRPWARSAISPPSASPW